MNKQTNKTFEEIDGALVLDAHNTIRDHLVRHIENPNPIFYRGYNSWPLILNEISGEISHANNTRDVIADLYGASYKPLDIEGYFVQYQELCDTGRKRVLEECDLKNVDSEGGFSMHENRDEHSKIEEIAREVSQGLESHFEA